MTKVKLPHVIAEAIEQLRKITYSNHDILRIVEHVLANPKALTVQMWAFEGGGGSPDLLMQALVNGYEIEKTPEEKVRGCYERNQDAVERSIRFGWVESEYMARGIAHGIKATLKHLGITIKGVNA